MIRVMMVDDHKLVVEGLRMDVLILDINLPDGNGIDICQKLKSFYPELKILALTSYKESSMVKQMLGNGASGYILKNAVAEEVLEGIVTVANGGIFLCHEVDILMKKGKESPCG